MEAAGVPKLARREQPRLGSRGPVSVALLAVFLLSSCGHRGVVIASPEHAYDRIHVGQTYVVPLFDGKIADVVAPVKDLGVVQIGYQSFALTNDVHVGSNRGQAFRVTGPGNGTILVALRAPQLKMRCASCRTVHYFFRASP
jgi:hypothetical protein